MLVQMTAQEARLVRRIPMTRKTRTFHLLVTSQVQISRTAGTTPAEVEADDMRVTEVDTAGPSLVPLVKKVYTAKR